MEHFAWPIAAFALGFVFLAMFRVQVASFISRVRTVGREGVSAQPLPEQRSIEQQADASTSKEIQALLQSFDSPALLYQERVLVAELDARKLDSTSDTTKVLVRYLAKNQIALGCEFVYRLIFGSQICFLKRVNTVAGGISEADAFKFYGLVAQQHPTAFPPDDPKPYFDFLTRQGVVTFESGHFRITDLGREFLIWLVQVGADENKPL